MKATDRDVTFLRAVQSGSVKHIHPFTWVLPLELLDYRGAGRTFDKLARAGLVKVDAGSTEYHRPVHLTEKGARLVEGGSMSHV